MILIVGFRASARPGAILYPYIVYSQKREFLLTIRYLEKRIQYWVVLPDPGEYERGLGTEDEMMFAIPAAKMETLIAGLRKNEKGYFAYRNHHPFMRPDFPRPDFYKQMFKSWGLDSN